MPNLGFKVPPRFKRQFLYTCAHRRPGNFQRPVTFSEKVNWRILYDRRPLLAWTCDKLRMKEAATACAIATPRTFWSGRDLAELVEVALPPAWVLKPNNRSGQVCFGEGPVAPAQLPRLHTIVNAWLHDARLDNQGEWAYSQARQCLLVEEMLGGHRTPPVDYKFFVFDGHPSLIQVDTDRFQGHRRRLYTPAWEPLPHQIIYPLAPIADPPQRLDEMLVAAACLGKSFDFIRVDLYNIDGAIYLGELTPYPDGGLAHFRPRNLDPEMGAMWRLPSLVTGQ